MGLPSWHRVLDTAPPPGGLGQTPGASRHRPPYSALACPSLAKQAPLGREGLVQRGCWPWRQQGLWADLSFAALLTLAASTCGSEPWFPPPQGGLITLPCQDVLKTGNKGSGGPSRAPGNGKRLRGLEAKSSETKGANLNLVLSEPGAGAAQAPRLWSAPWDPELSPRGC